MSSYITKVLIGSPFYISDNLHEGLLPWRLGAVMSHLVPQIPDCLTSVYVCIAIYGKEDNS